MRNIYPKKVKLLPDYAKKVFEGIIYDIYQWEQEMFDGSKEIFEMLKRADTVKVIAIKDNKVVVTKQRQPHIEEEFIDFPGGMNDQDDEDELQAAKRELEEETGMICSEWKLIEVIQPQQKIDQFVYTFIASDVVEERVQILDNGEQIAVELLELEDLKKMMETEVFRSPMPAWFKEITSVEELVSYPEFK